MGRIFFNRQLDRNYEIMCQLAILKEIDMGVDTIVMIQLLLSDLAQDMEKNPSLIPDTAHLFELISDDFDKELNRITTGAPPCST